MVGGTYLQAAAQAFVSCLIVFWCSCALTGGLNLQSKKGVCCNEYDGRPPEAIWELADGTVPNVHYRVMLEGQWVNVPDDAVLDVPNSYGVAVVWYSVTRLAPGVQTFYIRCFLPGQLI